MVFKGGKLKKALEDNDTNTAKACVKARAVPDKLFIQSFLFDCVASRNLAGIQTYIESGLNIERQIADNGRTMLYVAAEYGHYDIFQYLISKGAEANVYTDEGTSILYDITKNKYLLSRDMVTTLIEKGVPIDYQGNPNKETALMKAAVSARLEVASVLIELGADLTLKNESGHTAWNCTNGALKPLFPEYKIEQEKEEKRKEYLNKRDAIRAEKIQGKREISRKERQQETKDREEAGRGTWTKCFNDSVACVQVSEEISTELKEIFNFEARDVTSIYRNMQTDFETRSTTSFAEYTDKKQLAKAATEYNKLATTKITVNLDEIINIKIKMIDGYVTNKTKVAIMK